MRRDRPDHLLVMQHPGAAADLGKLARELNSSIMLIDPGTNVPRVSETDPLVELAGMRQWQADYALGRWAFRSLDLVVDHRVLIPRPETEVLAEMTLDECRRLDARVAVDLGTGSGALALALATERPGLEVWGTDLSADALEVARANLAELGRVATRVRLTEGAWFDALPADLAGRIDVIVANPPYVADDEIVDLPTEVRDWEPHVALFSGPSGLEDVEHIVARAPAWLARPGALLLEMAPHQTREAQRLARAAGFASVTVWPDLTGRDRIVLARL